jgi:drug/metabolite transporter (DMT)-like permease
MKPMNASASIPAPPAGAVVGALLAVQVLFAVNYVVSKVVVASFPPLVWASIRTGLSTGVMLAIALLMRRPHPPRDRNFFGPLVILALLGTVINQVAFLSGLRLTTATNSAVLNTLIPVFTLLIVTLRGQERATFGRVLGFLLAFGGVLALRGVENLSLSDATLRGDLLMILNCLSYALFLAYGKPFLSKHDPIWVTTWLFIYGSVGVTLLALPGWMEFTMPPMSGPLWGSAAFAVLGATLLTYFLNFWALRHARSSMVALFIYIQPPITSAIAWFYSGESVTVRTLASSVLIFAGLALGLRRGKPGPTEEARA